VKIGYISDIHADRFFDADVNFGMAGDPKLWIHGHVHDKWDYAPRTGRPGWSATPCQVSAGATLEVVEI